MKNNTENQLSTEVELIRYEIDSMNFDGVKIDHKFSLPTSLQVQKNWFSILESDNLLWLFNENGDFQEAIRTAVMGIIR